MPNRRAWGIDRSINPVYIGSLITALLGVLAWAGGVNSHFSTLDAAAVQQAKDIESSKTQIARETQERREDLRQINEKLDRLIERRR